MPNQCFQASTDTQPAPGGPGQSHVAVDTLICSRAAHFLGTSMSSMSNLVTALRYTADSAGPSSFFPRGRPLQFEELESDFFPLSASLPTEGELDNFFRHLEARVRGMPTSRHGICQENPDSPDVRLRRGWMWRTFLEDLSNGRTACRCRRHVATQASASLFIDVLSELQGGI
eukprot:s1240_g4.t1